MTRYKFYEMIAPATHLMIVGCTGSGKSVIENGLITHLLQTDSSFIMIDCKRVELALYKRSKKVKQYCDTPVKAVECLNKALQDIDKRYTRLAKKGLRKQTDSPVYIVIDELADLLTVDKKVIPLIQRITQIGRAANYHVIACTQILKADIIPTKLTYNFDSMILTRCESTIQSNHIIGCKEGVNLPRYGSCIHKQDGYLTRYDNIPVIPDNEIIKEIKRTNNTR